MWKVSAFISILYLCSAIINYITGDDPIFSCGVSLFFVGIMLICEQNKITTNKILEYQNERENND